MITNTYTTPKYDFSSLDVPNIDGQEIYYLRHFMEDMNDAAVEIKSRVPNIMELCLNDSEALHRTWTSTNPRLKKTFAERWNEPPPGDFVSTGDNASHMEKIVLEAYVRGVSHYVGIAILWAWYAHITGHLPDTKMIRVRIATVCESAWEKSRAAVEKYEKRVIVEDAMKTRNRLFTLLSTCKEPMGPNEITYTLGFGVDKQDHIKKMIKYWCEEKKVIAKPARGKYIIPRTHGAIFAATMQAERNVAERHGTGEIDGMLEFA